MCNAIGQYLIGTDPAFVGTSGSPFPNGFCQGSRHCPWPTWARLGIGRGHRQLDWLWSRQGRRGRLHEGLCPSGHAGDRGPGLKGLGSGGAILTGEAVIAAEGEQVVDRVVSGEEALGLPGDLNRFICRSRRRGG